MNVCSCFFACVFVVCAFVYVCVRVCVFFDVCACVCVVLWFAGLFVRVSMCVSFV